MHETKEPKDVSEEQQASAENEAPHTGDEESEENQEPEEGEGEQEEQGSSPFGPGMSPGINPEMIMQMAGMLGPLLGQILSRKSSPTPPVHAFAPPDPPAQMSMPRDVAHKLLLELYKPTGEVTNRQFRIGMGVGAAINMMGVQIAGEDLQAMFSNALDAVFNREGKAAKELKDAMSHSPHAAIHPGMAVPPGIRMPPGFSPGDGYDPIEGFEMPPGSVNTGGVQAMPPDMGEYQAPGLRDLPPMPDLGPQMKEEAKVRWIQMQADDPEGAEVLKSNGFDIERMFDEMGRIFGEFFPQHDGDSPEEHETADPQQEL